VDVSVDLLAPFPPERLWPWIADLGRYPQWLEIVHRAAPDGPDRWSVDLRARLGPLARSKRLRMARTFADGRRVRFEREETDGREHSAWVLEGDLAADDRGGSRLTMRLHYGGSRLSVVLERVLADEIERSRPRLLELVAADTTPAT
jgi:hypothetical protein